MHGVSRDAGGEFHGQNRGTVVSSRCCCGLYVFREDVGQPVLPRSVGKEQIDGTLTFFQRIDSPL